VCAFLVELHFQILPTATEATAFDIYFDPYPSFCFQFQPLSLVARKDTIRPPRDHHGFTTIAWIVSSRSSTWRWNPRSSILHRPIHHLLLQKIRVSDKLQKCAGLKLLPPYRLVWFTWRPSSVLVYRLISKVNLHVSLIFIEEVSKVNLHLRFLV
jgi:hypothetical protein